MTATDTVTVAFEEALARDAGLVRQAPPEVPPPPERDPEAPHGRDGDGKPLAPFGTKTDGTPRIKPPGPGRPPKVATVTTTSPASSSAKRSEKEYAEKVNNLAIVVWTATSNIKGFGIGKRKLKNGTVVPLVRMPDTRPFAAIWHEQTPQHVAAWTAACVQNETIAGYVDRFSGDGSMSWVLGVGLASLGLAVAVNAMNQQPPEVKAQVAAANDYRFQEFMKAQFQALGLEIEEDAA